MRFAGSPEEVAKAKEMVMQKLQEGGPQISMAQQNVIAQSMGMPTMQGVLWDGQPVQMMPMMPMQMPMATPMAPMATPSLPV